MLQWRFNAGNAALSSPVGVQEDGRIRVVTSGTALAGPGIDVPAGQLVARVAIEQATGAGTLALVGGDGGTLAEQSVDLDVAGASIAIKASLGEPVTGLQVRLTGDMHVDIVGLEIDLVQSTTEPALPDRPVGYESSKTFADKIASGFWRKYLGGADVLEIGYKGYYGTTVPIVPRAIGLDVGYPGYDGTTLPFADETFDGIYNSHCLEHIPDYRATIREWYRVLKVGGHMVIVVPHQHLFEKRAVMPSLSNYDHKRFYTAESLLRELAEALPENAYRIRHLRENDEGFDYSLPPRVSSPGQFEIELVAEKLRKPNWNSDDNTVRPYSAGEFFANGARRPNAWTIEVDFGRTETCILHGPYTVLRPARYVADFHFTVIELPHLQESTLRLDVSRNGASVVIEDLTGEAGLAKLRSGIVSVPFDVAETNDFEFRIFRGGAAIAGSARFRGVQLRYA